MDIVSLRRDLVRALNNISESYDILIKYLEILDANAPTEPDVPPTTPEPPSVPTGKQDWQCYLERYKDVAKVGNTKEWAERHYREWGKREGRVWGCAEPVGKSEQILWKPVSESRGGKAVVLIPANWTRYPSIEVNGQTFGYVDVNGHNGGRHHYWTDRPGSQFPNDTIVKIGDRRFLVKNPASRYETLPEATPSAKRFHHYNASAWHDRGVACILCPGDHADWVSIGNTQLRKHGNQDKGRDVWADYDKRGLTGTLKISINGQVYSTVITDSNGMTKGDCWGD